MNEHLKINLKRQASASIKAIFYQIWQSLYAWINLKDKEVLYLEGAEDFDQLIKNRVDTFQVKHTKRNITLDTSQIRNSIRNFWSTKKDNKDRKITYHLLTIAQRGYEKGKPFGKYKGLDYWDKCKSGLEDDQSLRVFLLKINKLSPGFPQDLIEFIQNSNKKNFLNELIRPLCWDTGSKSFEGLKNLVIEDIVTLGEKFNILPTESVKALCQLKEHVEEIIIQDELVKRKLIRANLLIKFQEATTVPIPLTELRQLNQQNLAIFTSLSQTIIPTLDQSTKVVIGSSLFQPIQIFTHKLVQREKLVAKAYETLRKNSLCVIQGSTGMGKSILSKLVIKNELDKWKQINLRGFNASQIKHIFNIVSESLKNDRTNILLDDFNFDGDSSLFEDILERILFESFSEGFRVIITTHNSIPSRILNNLNLPSECSFVIPSFSNDEIREMLLLFNCPLEKLDIWVKDLSYTSKGHPQLIHARIKMLSELSWPISKLLFDTSEIAFVKHEARKQLVDQLASNDAKELVFRLSIFIGRFHRKNALFLSNYPNRINIPGTVFDKLIGPYVEKINDDLFQLTPLLDDSAKQVYPENELQELHGLAGYSYISKTLTPLALSNIYFHGVMAHSGYLLSRGCMAFMSIKKEYTKYIYPHLDWFTLLHLKKGEKIFKEDEVLSMMLRHVQFSIIAEMDPKNCMGIVEAWEYEAKNFTGKVGIGKTYPNQVKMMPLMFYMNIFIRLKLPFSISRYTQWVCEAFDLLDNNPEFYSMLPSKLSSRNRNLDIKTFFAATLLAKKINIQTLDEFLTIIQNHKQGRILLEIINNDVDCSFRLIDNLWLEESKNKIPRWKPVIDALEKLIKYASKNNTLNIIASSLKAIAVIENEYLNKTDQAYKTIERGKDLIGYDHPVLLAYKAKISFFNKKYEEALEIWEGFIDSWKEVDNLTLALTYRDIGVSAANLGSWDKAAEWSEKSAISARNDESQILEQQCWADYAYALWNKGDTRQSIKTFANVIDKFSFLPDPSTNLRTLGLMKMLANFFIWIMKKYRPSQQQNNNIEPFPGMFSLLEYNPKLKDLPLSPVIALWTFLASIELEKRAGDLVFNRMIEVYDQLPILFKAEAKEIELSKYIYNGEVNTLVMEVAKFFTLTKKACETQNNHQVLTDISIDDLSFWAKQNVGLILTGLNLSILGYIRKKKIDTLHIKQWQKDAITLNISDEPLWQKWFEILVKFPNTQISELHQILGTGKEGNEIRMLTAILIMVQEDNPYYYFYSSVILISVLSYYKYWIKDAEENLECLIREKWQQIIENQRFALNSPSMNVPLIDHACRSDGMKGLKKAAKIILAARYSVDLRLENSMLDQLQQLII